ncbi:MAG: trigger factor [Desulfobacteraceae bacterium]|jgi:trigger factor|nr:trigger factor [Desulfobacteraceae bacterium]
MILSVEDLSPVKKVLHLEVPREQVASELDKAYDELRRTARIKGFRSGKAPRSVLERLYKKDVHADVAARLARDTLIEALQESELPVIGTPRLDPPDLDPVAAYRFDVTVEVKPDIADIDFKGLSLKKTVHEISEGEVDAQLAMLQRNLAKLKPVEEDRPVAQGDYVVIDYAGFFEGKPYDETAPTSDFTIKIGEGTIHKDFDAQLVGVKAGTQTEVKVDFPTDYFNDKLAGKAITFQVTVKEIRAEELPPIDDALAQRLGEYQSLEEIKGVIRENLETGYNRRSEQELHEEIFKALSARCSFEIPETLVEMELENIIGEAERSFSARNMTLEQVGLSKEQLAAQYRSTAAEQARRHLILDKVIRQENLTLPDEALEAGLEQMAKAYDQPVQIIKDLYRHNPEGLEAFKHSLLEKEAIKLIMDHSRIESVPASAENPAESES